MKIVRQILDRKGWDVWSIDAGAPVYDAIRMMAEKEIGALVVTDGGRLAGIISERDYARKVILKGKSSRETATREIMTRRVVTVGPDRTVQDCMALMTGRRIRHLPVTEGDRVVGMLSIRDLLRATIADQQFTIEQLERYITG
ncbi:MAG: CBS domain-containing protein [Acidobacteriota bacterium]